jgi:hypothetical protein
VAVLAVGCTGGVDDADTAPVTPSASPTSTSPSPTPTAASPTPSASPTEEAVAFGTGTVTVDGTEVAVSGDCDISRGFGEQPVEALDDEVDVLLAVDNVAGDGGHDGPFAVRVRLLGGGAVEGRTITSEGAPGEDGTTVDVTYEGEVSVAELRERRELEFLDTATLHLEATQERTSGSGGRATRELVVDVACPVSRPA